MNEKKSKAIVITLFIIWCGVLTLWLCDKANAFETQLFEPTPTTDYMSQMIACAVVGDVECGRQLADARNQKIASQGLTYSQIAFDDMFLLSKIIQAEAGSEWLSDDWKMSVGEVVLNRVASNKFPNTIKEVIEQPGQYYGKQSRYFESLIPNERCVKLAVRLLNGERVLNDVGVLYQANFKQGTGTHTALYDKYLGWTYFCKG